MIHLLFADEGKDLSIKYCYLRQPDLSTLPRIPTTPPTPPRGGHKFVTNSFHDISWPFVTSS